MKRRSNLAEARAKKRAAKEAGMTNPGGESKYALKKRGAYTPQIDPGKRECWFVRAGFLAVANFNGYQDGREVPRRASGGR